MINLIRNMISSVTFGSFYTLLETQNPPQLQWGISHSIQYSCIEELNIIFTFLIFYHR